MFRLGSDVFSGAGEEDIDALCRRALINRCEVGDKHFGKAVHLGAIASSELGIDAIHVQLPVADVAGEEDVLAMLALVLCLGFDTYLNQVHARIAWPFLTPLGILKLN